MAKKDNFNRKLAQALNHLIDQDKDLWNKGPNENAFNSNLYRRIKTVKEYKIDMEYDNYEIKSTAAVLANKDLKDYILSVTSGTKKATYSPKPDVIAHNDSQRAPFTNSSGVLQTIRVRNEKSIHAVVECKFNGDKNGIWLDFLKLCAYKLLFPNIEYLNIVVYPKRGVSNPKYQKLKNKFRKVYSKDTLFAALDELGPNHGTVLQVTPYPLTLNNLFESADINSKAYFKDSKAFIQMSEGIFEVEFDSNSKEILSINEAQTIPSDYDEVDVFENRKISEIEELHRDMQFNNLLISFGTPKERSFGELNYLRSGFDIKQDVGQNDEPYHIWRNTVVVTYEDGMLKLLLQNVDQNLVGFIKSKSMYSDNPNSRWQAFELDGRAKGNTNLFKSAVSTNRIAISKAVATTMQKAVDERGLKLHWSNSSKSAANSIISELKRVISNE